MTDQRNLSALTLPKRVIVDGRGNYWRVFDGSYSMCPVSTDNEPLTIAAVYQLAEADALVAFDSGKPLTECEKPDSITWRTADKTRWARDEDGVLYYSTIGTWHRAAIGK